MSFELRSNLHWCDCGGRAVFLDVEADRYFCLSEAANQAFLSLASGQSGDRGRLDLLIARGLLVEGDGHRPLPPAPSLQPAGRDFPAEPLPLRCWFKAMHALWHELWAARQVRSGPFHRLIARARSRANRCVPALGSGNRRIGTIVAAADAISMLTGSHDRCLVRALAMHAACTAAGIRPRLVFGVIAHPFSAHCWVQLGDAILTGGYEQARVYTPILVIE